MGVYQLGSGDFPPLRALHQVHLPAPANPLIGRKKELLDVVRLLARERARVVTVTGPGGTGKTRFSIAAAEECADAFPGGVWFADLAPVRDPALVVGAISAAMGATEALPEHIGDRQLLLVLDNLEQVVEAASQLAGLVASCPRLQLLCTSREALRIAPEREYELRPLPESPAIELFRQRAAAVAPDVEVAYDVAAAICERLDRLPLAIELAAARVKALDPQWLLKRLDRRLPLLTSRARDVPSRQRTLNETIAWSYELLADAEARLFRRLAVFAGGATPDAIDLVCEGDVDLVEALVDKSLVRRRGVRFRMLETIREYAAEQLAASGESHDAYRRLACWLLERLLAANLTAVADGPMEHAAAIDEQDNLRAALDWAVDVREAELGLRLAVAAEQFWVTHSPVEGYRRLRMLIDHLGEQLAGRLRADALRACASTIYIAGEYATGTSYIERSLEEYRGLGDEAAVGHMMMRLAVEAARVGDFDRAARLAEESLELCARGGYRRGEPQALAVLARVARARGDVEGALDLHRRAAEVAASIGFVWWEAGQWEAVAAVELRRGEPARAAVAARNSLRLASRIGDRWGSVFAAALLAAAAARTGDATAAGRLWGAIEAEEGRGPIGQWEDHREELAADVLRAAGDAFERARALGRAAAFDDTMAWALGE